MKIGVVLPDGFKAEAGGAFSYIEKLIYALDEHDFGKDIVLCFVTRDDRFLSHFKRHVICVSVVPGFLKRMPGIGKYFYKLESFLLRKRGERIFSGKGLSLMYYLRQGECYCENFPFIATNWDIGHCSTYPFPELCSKQEIKRRRRYYEDFLPRALMVMVDSESGKEELLRYTNIGEYKIAITPIFAGGIVEAVVTEPQQEEILCQNNLSKQKYFIYPAQIWPHKNHVGLVKAFAQFLPQHPEYKLVFSGANKGNIAYLKGIIAQLGITDSVLFLGFISKEELKSLYVNSTALVMASHFGPTNMPPIEAMNLGVPVICSDLKGHREILGEAGVYFNSLSTDSIILALNEIAGKRSYYEKLIREKSDQSVFKIEKTIEAIGAVLNKVVLIRENWD